MRRYLGLAALAVAIAALTFGIFIFVSTDRGPAPEEYAVWSSLMDNLLASEQAIPQKSTILIEQTTESADLHASIVPLQLLALGTDREARDFLAKNKHSWPIHDTFTITRPYKLVDRSAVRQFIVCQYSSCSSSTIGAQTKAIFTLSRVGFDLWHRHALVEFSYLCGRTCGRGGYVSLRKQDGHWFLDHFGQGWMAGADAGNPANSLPISPEP